MSQKPDRSTLTMLAFGFAGAVFYMILTHVKIALCTGLGSPRIIDLGKLIYDSNKFSIKLALFLCLFPMVVNVIGRHFDIRNRIFLLLGSLGISVFLPLVTEQKLSCNDFYFFAAFCVILTLESKHPVVRIFTLIGLSPIFYILSHGPTLFLNEQGPAFRDLNHDDVVTINWMVTVVEVLISYTSVLVLGYISLLLIPSVSETKLSLAETSSSAATETKAA